ncbi:hypothetical protein GQ54DRAFT_33417 [Martensiomyces pterosporus]|nr:hypothetical protein GQ54DRAFT_33417 [Martensiomyces pterosporus]
MSIAPWFAAAFQGMHAVPLRKPQTHPATHARVPDAAVVRERNMRLWGESRSATLCTLHAKRCAAHHFAAASVCNRHAVGRGLCAGCKHVAASALCTGSVVIANWQAFLIASIITLLSSD